MKIYAKASLTQFIYPFIFDLENYSTLCQSVDQATWISGVEAIQFWCDKKFPADNFLPHVAKFLKPTDNEVPALRIWEIRREAQHFVTGLAENKFWQLEYKSGSRANLISFSFASIQLVLFQSGVGFLTFEAKPNSESLDDWLNFNHFFRFGQRDTTYLHAPDDFAFLQSKYPQNHLKYRARELVKAILNTARPNTSNGSDGRWWENIFVAGQFIPLVTLYIDEMEERAFPETVNRVRRFFHSSQQILLTAEEMDLANHPALLPYAANQWFTFSLEGGTFIAIDAPIKNTFFRTVQPGHVRTVYFLLFILAMQQRFTLMKMTKEISENWLNNPVEEFDPAEEAAFSKIRANLLLFTARERHFQVVQRDNQHRYYQKWVEIFQLDELYQNVREQVQELHEYLVDKRDRRAQKLAEIQDRAANRFANTIAFVATLVVVPSLVTSFLGINIINLSSDSGLSFEQALWYVGASLLVAILTGSLVVLILWLIKRRDLKSR